MKHIAYYIYLDPSKTQIIIITYWFKLSYQFQNLSAHNSTFHNVQGHDSNWATMITSCFFFLCTELLYTAIFKLLYSVNIYWAPSTSQTLASVVQKEVDDGIYICVCVYIYIHL